MGLGLGLVIALMVELINRRVRGAEDLVTAARVPVLAVIGERQRPAWREKLRQLLSRRGAGTPAFQPAQ